MKADHVRVSWDPQKNKWAVRVEVGAEVIRRYCDQPKGADEQSLRAAATKTAIDEGYEVEPANVSVQR
jgi:hypothetical protein